MTTVYRRWNPAGWRSDLLPIATAADVRVRLLLICHLFVMIYEEPALTRKFGQDYEVYRHQVKRWWPGKPI